MSKNKIKVLIELDEELFKNVVEHVKDHYIGSDDVWVAVANGTPYNPSGDLISREALKKAFDDYIKANPNLSGIFEVGKYIIDNAQAIDLWKMRQEATENALKKAEVLYGRPKGEWRFNERGSFYCSVCNGEPYDQYATTAFCPFCGADMKGGDDK